MFIRRLSQRTCNDIVADDSRCLMRSARDGAQFTVGPSNASLERRENPKRWDSVTLLFLSFRICDVRVTFERFEHLVASQAPIGHGGIVARNSRELSKSLANHSVAANVRRLGARSRWRKLLVGTETLDLESVRCLQLTLNNDRTVRSRIDEDKLGEMLLNSDCVQVQFSPTPLKVLAIPSFFLGETLHRQAEHPARIAERFEKPNCQFVNGRGREAWVGETGYEAGEAKNSKKTLGETRPERTGYPVIGESHKSRFQTEREMISALVWNLSSAGPSAGGCEFDKRFSAMDRERFLDGHWENFPSGNPVSESCEEAYPTDRREDAESVERGRLGSLEFVDLITEGRAQNSSAESILYSNDRSCGHGFIKS